MLLQYVTGHPKEAGAFLVILVGLVLLVVGLMASTDRAVRYQLGVKIEIDQMASGKKRAFEGVGASLFAAGLLMLFFVIDWSSGAASTPAASLPTVASLAVTAPVETQAAPLDPTPAAPSAPATPPPPAATPVPSDLPAPTSLTAAPSDPSPTSAPGVSIGLGDGEAMAQYTLITGTHGPNVTGDIWLLVRPSNGRYYPQSADPCGGERTFRANGRWEVPAVFGEANSIGQAFEVIAVTADTEASDALAATCVAWCQAEDYPGLEELPAGVKVEDRVRVVRGPESAAAPTNLTTTEVPGSLTITGLSDGDAVPESLTLGGTVSADAAGHIWVLVYPFDAGRWYPQSSSACTGTHTERDGDHWQVNACFGPGGSTQYALAVVLANERADAHLSALQEEWCRSGHYPGLRTIELPWGIEEKARVLVHGQ